MSIPVVVVVTLVDAMASAGKSSNSDSSSRSGAEQSPDSGSPSTTILPTFPYEGPRGILTHLQGVAPSSGVSVRILDDQNSFQKRHSKELCA